MSYFDLIVKKSDILAQFRGGNKVENYKKSFEIQLDSRDPDLSYDWNEDPDITVQMSCLDLSIGRDCETLLGKVYKPIEN